MRIKVWVRTDKVGSKCEREIDIDEDDDISDASMEEIALQEVWSMAEWGWEKI